MAYQRLADLGLRYTATWQDDAVTAKRLRQGDAYLAFAGERLIGTIVLEDQIVCRGCEWYDRSDVASFHQFAVHPDHQGHGVGRQLLTLVEDEARAAGARELALDTAEWAYHLIDMYLRCGYRFVGDVQWKDTNYRSVIMSKRLVASLTAPPVPAVTPVVPFLRDAPTPDPAKALHDLEQATVRCVRLDDRPGLIVNRLRTAIAYQYAERRVLAEHIFRQLLRDLPEDSEQRHLVHQQYGKFLVEQRQFAEARAHFKAASADAALQALEELTAPPPSAQT